MYDSNEEEEVVENNALLLGMVFSASNMTEINTLEKGDRERCRALEENNIKVYTMDSQHDVTMAMAGKHIHHNFCNVGALLEMDKIWRGTSFKYIIMDYFYTSTSFCNESWRKSMFTTTLPMLAAKGAIKLHGEVWLPNITRIRTWLDRLWPTYLSKWYTKQLVDDPMLNPLYEASQKVENNQKESKESFSNEAALKALPSAPFIMLKCIISGDGLETDEVAGCGSLLSRIMPSPILKSIQSTTTAETGTTTTTTTKCNANCYVLKRGGEGGSGTRDGGD